MFSSLGCSHLPFQYLSFHSPSVLFSVFLFSFYSLFCFQVLFVNDSSFILIYVSCPQTSALRYLHPQVFLCQCLLIHSHVCVLPTDVCSSLPSSSGVSLSTSPHSFSCMCPAHRRLLFATFILRCFFVNVSSFILMYVSCPQTSALRYLHPQVFLCQCLLVHSHVCVLPTDVCSSLPSSSGVSLSMSPRSLSCMCPAHRRLLFATFILRCFFVNVSSFILMYVSCPQTSALRYLHPQVFLCQRLLIHSHVCVLPTDVCSSLPSSSGVSLSTSPHSFSCMCPAHRRLLFATFILRCFFVNVASFILMYVSCPQASALRYLHHQVFLCQCLLIHYHVCVLPTDVCSSLPSSSGVSLSMSPHSFSCMCPAHRRLLFATFILRCFFVNVSSFILMYVSCPQTSALRYLHPQVFLCQRLLIHSHVRVLPTDVCSSLPSSSGVSLSMSPHSFSCMCPAHRRLLFATFILRCFFVKVSSFILMYVSCPQTSALRYLHPQVFLCQRLLIHSHVCVLPTDVCSSLPSSSGVSLSTSPPSFSCMCPARRRLLFATFILRCFFVNVASFILMYVSCPQTSALRYLHPQVFLCQRLLVHYHICVLPTDVCSSLPSSSGVSLSMSPRSFSCMCPAHRRLLFATFILRCFFVNVASFILMYVSCPQTSALRYLHPQVFLCQCLLVHYHICVLPTDVCSSLPSSSGVSLSMSPRSFSCMCPAHRRLLFATFILRCFFVNVSSFIIMYVSCPQTSALRYLHPQVFLCQCLLVHYHVCVLPTDVCSSLPSSSGVSLSTSPRSFSCMCPAHRRLLFATFILRCFFVNVSSFILMYVSCPQTSALRYLHPQVFLCQRLLIHSHVCVLPTDVCSSLPSSSGVSLSTSPHSFSCMCPAHRRLLFATFIIRCFFVNVSSFIIMYVSCPQTSALRYLHPQVFLCQRLLIHSHVCVLPTDVCSSLPSSSGVSLSMSPHSFSCMCPAHRRLLFATFILRCFFVNVASFILMYVSCPQTSALRYLHPQVFLCQCLLIHSHVCVLPTDVCSSLPSSSVVSLSMSPHSFSCMCPAHRRLLFATFILRCFFVNVASFILMYVSCPQTSALRYLHPQVFLCQCRLIHSHVCVLPTDVCSSLPSSSGVSLSISPHSLSCMCPAHRRLLFATFILRCFFVNVASFILMYVSCPQTSALRYLHPQVFLCQRLLIHSHVCVLPTDVCSSLPSSSGVSLSTSPHSFSCMCPAHRRLLFATFILRCFFVNVSSFILMYVSCPQTSALRYLHPQVFLCQSLLIHSHVCVLPTDVCSSLPSSSGVSLSTSPHSFSCMCPARRRLLFATFILRCFFVNVASFILMYVSCPQTSALRYLHPQVFLCQRRLVHSHVCVLPTDVCSSLPSSSGVSLSTSPRSLSCMCPAHRRLLFATFILRCFFVNVSSFILMYVSCPQTSALRYLHPQVFLCQRRLIHSHVCVLPTGVCSSLPSSSGVSLSMSPHSLSCMCPAHRRLLFATFILRCFFVNVSSFILMYVSCPQTSALRYLHPQVFLCQSLLIHSHVCVLPTDVCSSLPSSSGVSLSMSPHSFSCMCPAHRRLLFATFILRCFFVNVASFILMYVSCPQTSALRYLHPQVFLCQCLLIHSHVCVLPTDVCSSLPSSSGVSLSTSPHSFSCMCPAHRRLLFATFILSCFFVNVASFILMYVSCPQTSALRYLHPQVFLCQCRLIHSHVCVLPTDVCSSLPSSSGVSLSMSPHSFSCMCPAHRRLLFATFILRYFFVNVSSFILMYVSCPQTSALRYLHPQVFLRQCLLIHSHVCVLPTDVCSSLPSSSGISSSMSPHSFSCMCPAHRRLLFATFILRYFFVNVSSFILMYVSCPQTSALRYLHPRVFLQSDFLS